MTETRIRIEHLPREQRITVESPGGRVEFQIVAPPSIALRALASWLERWADGRRSS